MIFSRAGRAPVWLLLPGIPLILRAKAIEWKLLPFYGGKFRVIKDGPNFLLSAFEVSDKLLDGITMPVMFYNDAKVHGRWIESFLASRFRFISSLAPAANWMHLW